MLYTAFVGAAMAETTSSPCSCQLDLVPCTLDSSLRLIIFFDFNINAANLTRHHSLSELDTRHTQVYKSTTCAED